MSNKLTQDIIRAKSKSEDLSTIKCLNLWGSDIEDIEILNEMKHLEIVSLSGNMISTLYPFSNMEKLSELYLRKNNICKLEEIQHLRNCKSLKILWLQENPCCLISDYRTHVIRLLPQILKLDNMLITDEEREKAGIQKQRKYTLNVMTTSSDTTTTDTDRSMLSVQSDRRGSSSSKFELKSKQFNEYKDLKFQKLKSKSKIPAKKTVTVYKNYESNNSVINSSDKKACIISAIESLIKVLNSPELKYVRGMIDKKLKL